MPIYEYRCADCGTHLEKMQKISDAPLTVCESCGGKLEKQISRAGFQFKGSGWYVTDYAGKGKSDTKTETAAESKTETKTEKSSAGESTAKTDGASKTTADNNSSPKTTKTE